MIDRCNGWVLALCCVCANVDVYVGVCVGVWMGASVYDLSRKEILAS